MSRAAVGARLALLCAAVAAPVSAQMQHGRSGDASVQARREALGRRIDSLSARHRQLELLVRERASTAAAAAAQLPTDTVVVGPFLFVNRTAPAAGVVTALEDAWQAYAAMVGPAAAQFDGIIISRDVSRDQFAGADPQVRHYLFHVPDVRGPDDIAGAADGVVTNVLVGEMPADVRAWLRQAGLVQRNSFEWAYRDLALSTANAGRGCFARDADACSAALTRDAAHELNPATLASFLRYVLEQGGAGSYARLLEDAPDIGARLAHAAGRPLDEVVMSWRTDVQKARPRIHAGVARAGFWTVIWLIGLGLLAMRSTRWRLG